MNGGARINLEDAWPISDEEGRGLTGYTFTVENKCEDPVNYIIALESLESTKGLEYLNNNYVKLAIDDEIEKRYGSLDTIENVVLENDLETIRETKEVTTATVAGNSINEHTIRIWLSEDAPLTEQNKVFTSRVRITGGQGVENTNVPSTADACFTIDENGEILGYDESCGESVVIPARINGTPVKTIDTDAFKTEVVEKQYGYLNSNFEEVDGEENVDFSTATHAFVIPDFEPGQESFDTSKMQYVIMYVNNEITAGLESQLPQMESQLGRDIPIYKAYEGDAVPELEANQIRVYQNADATGNITLTGAVYLVVNKYKELAITSLDLSKATYLEKIEEIAFSTFPITTMESDGCVYKVLDIANADENNMPTGLNNLILGKQKNLKLGNGAFAMLNMNELTVYTNIEGYNNCDYPSAGRPVSQAFGYANFNTLNISSLDGNTMFAPNSNSGLFMGAKVNHLNINEGITEIGAESFVFLNVSGNITLPNSLEKIEYRAFGIGQGDESLSVTIPDKVNYIGEQAFWLWPRTTTINFTRTEAEVKSQITFGDSWNHNAQITYED